ncbi:hypothetical protein VAEKB19_5550014 [Vibrio aestuarianus]|nr:hypothetical protein VAEKB19_5550014 [Vibrio aestuarianus]
MYDDKPKIYADWGVVALCLLIVISLSIRLSGKYKLVFFL